MEEELEINFRLDKNGRTEDTREERSPGVPNQQPMDYASKTHQANISLASYEDATNADKYMDELYLDCEIADSGLMPRTFWVPADGKFVPRCSLEQMAFDIFQFHVGDRSYDPKLSGAEWWVQLRPSPEAGRYSMHSQSEGSGDMSTSGISFHWDKDEELRILCGGSTYVHPHVSTVTYLTSIGAPTLVLSRRLNPYTGEWVEPENQVNGFLSWPKQGKHLSFDGRYLHAAPPDLMEKGEFAKQIEFEATQEESLNKKLKRRHRRVTFLVNIWLNFHPFDVKPFPETMVEKLSGHKERANLSFGSQDEANKTTVLSEESSAASQGLRRCTWPLGDCGSDERIEVDMPINDINSCKSQGGNARILWDGKGRNVKLYAGKPDTESDTKRQRLP